MAGRLCRTHAGGRQRPGRDGAKRPANSSPAPFESLFVPRKTSTPIDTQRSSSLDRFWDYLPDQCPPALKQAIPKTPQINSIVTSNSVPISPIIKLAIARPLGSFRRPIALRISPTGQIMPPQRNRPTKEHMKPAIPNPLLGLGAATGA